MDMRKQLSRMINWMLVGAVLSFLPVAAWAETEEERRDRMERIEQMKRTEDVTGSSAQIFSKLSKSLGWFIDYGGTARFTHTGGRDNDRSYSTQDALAFTREYEGNAYLNMTDFTRKTKFYSRARTTYTERRKNSASTRGNEWTQFEVDAMYFERKFKGGVTNTTLTAGRTSVSVGRGIAFAGTCDGVQIEMGYKRNMLTMFAARMDRSLDDIDPGNISPPSRNHTHRRFLGYEYRWNAHPLVSPYLYYVKSQDRSSRKVDPQTFEMHIYEPTFFGYGVGGIIVIPNLTYFGEFIRAYGTTTSQGDKSDTTPVDAAAFDIGVRYQFPGKYMASISYEYAYASGDRDRQTTVNSTLLGNRNGPDEAFRPFGGLGLGYALAPTFVNLRATKFGTGFRPFVGFESSRFRDVMLQAEFYLFERAVLPGPISDMAAYANDNARSKIGKEFNLTLTWQAMNDVRTNVRLGKFVPSTDSYGTESNFGDGRRYIMRGGDPEIYVRVQCSLDI